MKKHILVVDDSSADLYMLETLLKGYGYDVTTAENGEQALEKARRNPPGLVISDSLMPVMDGYSLCREWKADDTLRHRPFVLYTATYTDPRDEKFALDLGVDRFILKPQEPDVLAGIVRELLEDGYRARQVETKPLDEEMQFFRQYNEILFQKLEQKMADLETANRDLRLSEESYRRTFLNASDVIYTIDSNLMLRSISPSVEPILGYKAQDFVDRPVTEFGRLVLTPESFERAIADVATILGGQRIASTVYEFIAKDGTLIYGEVSGSPLKQDGKVTGIVSVARDITDRVRAEETLRALSSRQEAILAAVPEIIMEVDNNKVYTWANSGGVEFFGEDVIGKEAAFYFEGEQETYDTVRPLFKGSDDVVYLESWQRRKDGEKRLLAWWCRVLKDKSGHVTGTLSSARDITDRKQAEEALQESEKKYRELYDFLPIPVYEMDFEAHITAANRAVFETFEATQEDLKQGVSAWQALSPEQIEKSAKNIERLLKGERIEGTEYTLRKMDGTRFPAIVISSVIHRDGKPVGLRGAIIDITERKRQEDQLQFKNILLTTQQEASIDGILVVDEKSQILSYNKQFVKMWGIPANLIADRDDKSVLQFVMGQMTDSASFFRRVQCLYEHRHETSRDEIILADGRVFDRYSAPMLGPDDRYFGRVWYFRDITEQKHAEEELRKSEASFQDLFNEAPVGYFEYDDRGRVSRVNRTFLEMMGYRMEELVSRPVWMFIQDEKAPQQVMSKLAGTMAPFKGVERVYRRKDGTILPILVQDRLLYDEQGGIKGIRCTVQDITDLKQTQENLQTLREHLLQAEKLASIGRLSAGVAHEILNPVNNISMELQLLMANEDLPLEVLEELKVCMTQIERIVAITQDLKQFSRLPSQKAVMADINDTIAHILNLYATQLKIDEIETNVQFQPDLPMISMDKQKIEQVILNLITNAVDAMEGKEKKVLRIGTEQERTGGSDSVKITIADNGKGIRSKDLAKIYDPFFTTKESGKGTGLGLSISYGIIRDHGGMVWAANNEWGGASFYVRLPVKKMED